MPRTRMCRAVGGTLHRLRVEIVEARPAGAGAQHLRRPRATARMIAKEPLTRRAANFRKTHLRQSAGEGRRRGRDPVGV